MIFWNSHALLPCGNAVKVRNQMRRRNARQPVGVFIWQRAQLN